MDTATIESSVLFGVVEDAAIVARSIADHPSASPSRKRLRCKRC